MGQYCDLLLVLVVLHGVVALSSENEIGRNELSALMEELIEGVLSVGGWLSEKDGARGVVDVLASTGDGFSIGLHGQLLEIGRESMEILIKSAVTVSLSRNRDRPTNG
jgi:hypothetical protein